MGEQHTTYARAMPRRITDPRVDQIRQLIREGEVTFSRPKRFPKGSIRLTPRPTTSYSQLLAKLAVRREPSFPGLVRVFACGVVVAFATALAVFVAAR
jgi:hypothetical protein